MKQQTIEEMIIAGATPTEARQAAVLLETLRPGLRVKRNGRVDTTGGDKTELGLLLTVKRILSETE